MTGDRGEVPTHSNHYLDGAKTLWEALEMGIYCDIELVYVSGNNIIRFPTIKVKEDVVHKKIFDAEELKKYLVIPPEFVAPAPRPGYEWYIEYGCTSTMDSQPETWATLYPITGNLDLRT
jgi:hypothetical protein